MLKEVIKIMTTHDVPNPETIKSWANAASATINFLKMSIGLLPSGKNKEQAEHLLAEAEKEHKQAEAASALKLGFELCQYCWPPEVVLMSPEHRRLECRHCHRPPLQVEREETFWKVAQKNQLNHNV